MKNNGVKALESFVEDIHRNREWWHMIPIRGNEDKDNHFQNMFPLVSTIFGLHVNDMEMYLIKVGYLRRCEDHATICNIGLKH